MATGTYAPDPDLHVVDANGLPVNGGLVWTYLAGTTTLTPTYTDVGLTVPNTNPIVAGSDGRFVAFLVGGTSYKFVYETAALPPAHGAVLATRDNILAVTTIVPGTGAGVEQVTSLTGTANDLALVPGCAYLYCVNASPLTITGFSGGVFGQRLTVFGTSTLVNLAYEHAGSLAANRLLNFATSAPSSLSNSTGGGQWGSATYVYHGQWIMVSHEQGGWITPPFSGANFGGSASMNWNVSAGGVSLCQYRVSGNALTFCFAVSGTLSGTMSSSLVMSNNLFGGYTLTAGIATPITLSDASGPTLTGYGQSFATYLTMQKASGANYPAGTAAVYGSIVLPIL